MKFGQLIEYEKRKTFLHKSCKKCGRETKSRPLFIFKTALYEGKASCLQYRTLDYWFRNKLNFDLLEMGLGIVSPAHFENVSCLMLSSMNWPNSIVWLFLFIMILGNMCIPIVYFGDCEIMDFEINLVFLIKPFFYLTKKSRERKESRLCWVLIILRTKRAFKMN